MTQSRLQLWMQPQESPGLGPRSGKAGRDWPGEVRAELEGAEEDLLGAGPLILNFPEAMNDLPVRTQLEQAGSGTSQGIMDSGFN